MFIFIFIFLKKAKNILKISRKKFKKEIYYKILINNRVFNFFYI